MFGAPEGHLYVIRDIVFTPATGEGGSAALESDTGVTLWYSGPTDPAGGQTLHFEGRIAIPAGTLVTASVGEGASLVVSGYDLLTAD